MDNNDDWSSGDDDDLVDPRYSLTQSLTHTYSLTVSLTHSLTHSFQVFLFPSNGKDEGFVGHEQ